MEENIFVTRIAGRNTPQLHVDFKEPRGVAVDLEGNIIIVDTGNHVIRKIQDGVVTVIAGSGKEMFGDGFKREAHFRAPRGVAIAKNGDIIISDTFNHRIRKITPDGEVTTIAGNGEKNFKDGNVLEASFSEPRGIIIDDEDCIVVADTENHRVRMITPDGQVTTIAGNGTFGYVDGDVEDAQFNRPHGIIFDLEGNIVVSDHNNHCIRVISDKKVSTLAGSGDMGYNDGIGSEAEFNCPFGMVLIDDGSIIVSDVVNNKIRRVTRDGKTTTLAGAEGGLANGKGHEAQFDYPNGLAVDMSGNIIVADVYNHCIRMISGIFVPPVWEIQKVLLIGALIETKSPLSFLPMEIFQCFLFPLSSQTAAAQDELLKKSKTVTST